MSEPTTESLLNWSLLDDPAVLKECQRALREDGAMTLPNFATQKGMNRLKEEVVSCPYNESRQNYSPWQDQGDLVHYPPSHPRNYKTNSSAAFVGRKSLEQTKDCLCVSILENDQRLLQFLSKVANKPLFRSTDENGSIYCYRITEKHNPPWHYDESPYTAIVYLQNGEGGQFEYIPWSRPTTSKDDPQGHAIVKQVLMEGNTDKVQQIPAQPGTLLFFSGAHSFHRAAPARSLRLGLVFTFALQEGFANSESVKSSNEWDLSEATCIKGAET